MHIFIYDVYMHTLLSDHRFKKKRGSEALKRELFIFVFCSRMLHASDISNAN